jgi:hypothetical protein
MARLSTAARIAFALVNGVGIASNALRVPARTNNFNTQVISVVVAVIRIHIRHNCWINLVEGLSK